MSSCSRLLFLTWAVVASVPINRMKRLLPHLFASGDDDGVIKVSTTSSTCISVYPQYQSVTPSSGTPENRMLYASTRTILTSSPTFCGWMTKSSLSLRGTSSPFRSSRTRHARLTSAQRGWHPVRNGRPVQKARARSPVRRPGRRAALYFTHQRVRYQSPHMKTFQTCGIHRYFVGDRRLSSGRK